MRFFTIFFAILPLIPGCSLFQGDLIDPVIDVEGKRLAVIPFKDRLNPYFESEPGTQMAETIAYNLQKNAEELRVVDFNLLNALSQKEDLSRCTLEEIGRKLRANLLLIGDIKTFSTRQRGEVGILRGKAVIDLRAIDLAAEGKVAWKGRVEVHYPAKGPASWGISTTEATEEDIRYGLIRRAAKKIAEKFYPHEDDTPRKGL
jgi:hypothetical protein